ncbi:ESX secretion-associated protein EspG [Nocardia amamiensis]|uniref:ESX secretion-associated protein EspG n=1 Tax=Nocardia amamiensis TaxID=404578 RepID=UPI0033F3CDB4
MATANSWRLPQIEFHLAWEAMGRDRMPFPLAFHTNAETQLDFERECRSAAKSLVDKIGDDDSLYRALQALAQPQVRVEMLGYRRDGRDRMVRVSAGIDDGIGTVAAQHPGPDIESGGDILIFMHSPSFVVKRVASILPDVPPGSAAGIDVHREDLAPEERAWTASHTPTPREAAARFFNRPYRTYVEIRIDTGPALDGWEEGGRYLQVVDFVDEGRYLVQVSERLVATPVTKDRLEAEIQRRIDRAMVEAHETAWS